MILQFELLLETHLFFAYTHLITFILYFIYENMFGLRIAIKYLFVIAFFANIRSSNCYKINFCVVVVVVFFDYFHTINEHILIQVEEC